MCAYYKDPDPQETREWLEALDGVIKHEGGEKADYLLRVLTDRARTQGVATSPGILTPYCNTISPEQEEKIPGDSYIARNVAAYVRWNAMAMVVHANRKSSEYGGHISSYASSATLYEVGFNHFWRAPTPEHGGDLVELRELGRVRRAHRKALLGNVLPDRVQDGLCKARKLKSEENHYLIVAAKV